MSISKKRPYSRWTDEQINTLTVLVTQRSSKRISWVTIAQHLDKTPRQCYDQWLNICKKKQRMRPVDYMPSRFKTPQASGEDAGKGTVDVNEVVSLLASLTGPVE